MFYDANTIKKSSDKPFRPIVIAASEKKLEEKMNAKWEKNLEKYKNYRLVRIYIQQIPKNIGKTDFVAPGIGGSLAISVMFYTLSQKNKVKHNTYDGSAMFWYTDEQLAKRKFSTNDIKLAIKAVMQEKVDFNPFAVYHVDLLDQLYRKQKKND